MPVTVSVNDTSVGADAVSVPAVGGVSTMPPEDPALFSSDHAASNHPHTAQSPGARVTPETVIVDPPELR